jgi:glycosyltransferase involved in cell wall biosynthesis
MDNKTLLVVMPAYNAEETIEKAIRGILRQTYSNLHLVIVDDASTDNTVALASQFLNDPRVTIFKNKKNMGAYYGRNFGLHAFKDEPWGFFTTHDADDFSLSTRYKELLRFLRSKTNAVQDMFIRKDLYTKKVISSKITMAHAVFKRSVFNRIGYFDDTRFAGDWEQWQRLKMSNQVLGFQAASFSKELGESYIHKNNLTVIIPEGSQPRLDYVEAKKSEILLMQEKKNFYRDFTPANGKVVRVKASAKKPLPNKSLAPRLAIILLTWRRPGGIREILEQLSRQTYEDFTVYLSIGDLKRKSKMIAYANFYKEARGMDIRVREDGNELYSFRRLIIGKELAEKGSEIILFLDDDISIPQNYVELCLDQYEENTYHSSYAWSFINNGKNYYTDRERSSDNSRKIHYCGAGVSMLDAKILLSDGLTNPDKIPKGAYKIEDLWLSYYVDHILKLRLKHIDIPGVKIGGADDVALHKAILSESYNKTDFLYDLKKMGWRIPKKPIKV